MQNLPEKIVEVVNPDALSEADLIVETEQVDWYERRNELAPDQVFRIYDGDIVKLFMRVIGDATEWEVLSWDNGWFNDGYTIEPGDLVERLPDDFNG